MGCTETRQQIAFEETFLADQQKRLGFDIKDAVEVDMIIRKYCFNNYVNTSQLSLIENELGLILHDEGDWPEVNKMMSYLENSHGWESKKLLILGILCSNSNNYIKAKLLFEAYDEHFSGRLNTAQIRELLNEMCMIAGQALGALVDEKDKNFPMMDRYLRKCTASAERSVLNLMKHFKAVNSDADFVRTIASLHSGMLLSPAGIRNYLHIEYTRNGPGKDWSNADKVRNRANSLGQGASRVRSMDQVKQDRQVSFETNSTNDEPERGSAGQLASLEFDLSKLR
mmetsp:Transcript_7728/g.14644  ORF Transcript_7728/g.14644 Transcript_7728/m.14644 type:complete len:284 (-) Transcript_7728:1228-2079(-)